MDHSYIYFNPQYRIGGENWGKGFDGGGYESGFPLGDFFMTILCNFFIEYAIMRCFVLYELQKYYIEQMDWFG
jgi:hypothetical protein